MTTNGPSPHVNETVKAHRRQLMADSIEGVAMQLFLEHGYSNVTIEDVARAAGVSPRTFYRYFATKEDVLTRFPARLTEFVRSALADDTVSRSIFEVFSSVLVRLAESVDLDELRRWCSVMSSDHQSIGSMALNDLRLRELMEPEFRQRFSDCDPMRFDLALRAGQAAMTAATTDWFLRGGDFVSLVREALDVLSQGFRSSERKEVAGPATC